MFLKASINALFSLVPTPFKLNEIVEKMVLVIASPIKRVNSKFCASICGGPAMISFVPIVTLAVIINLGFI